MKKIYTKKVLLYLSYYERSVNGKLESNSSHAVELKFPIVLFKDAILGFTDATLSFLYFYCLVPELGN